jgi:hypothetical protein
MLPMLPKTCAVWLIALLLSPLAAPLFLVEFTDLSRGTVSHWQSVPSSSRADRAATHLRTVLLPLPAVQDAVRWRHQTPADFSTVFLSHPSLVVVVSSVKEVGRTGHGTVTPTLRI